MTDVVMAFDCNYVPPIIILNGFEELAETSLCSKMEHMMIGLTIAKFATVKHRYALRAISLRDDVTSYKHNAVGYTHDRNPATTTWFCMFFHLPWVSFTPLAFTSPTAGFLSPRCGLVAP